MFRALLDRLSGARPKGAARPPEAAAPAGPSAADWKARGNAALAAGRLAEAARCYEEGALAHPRDAALRLNIGFVLLQQGHAARAEERLGQAVALHLPGDGVAHDAWYLLGRAQAAQGRLQEALTSFGSAARAKADFAEAIEAAVRAAHQLGRHEEAATWGRQLVGILPDTGTRVLLAGSLLRCGRQEEAAELLEQTCEQAPDNLDAAFLRYEVLRQAGRMEEALVQAERVLQLTGPHPVALANLALVLARLDRLDDGLARVEQALALDPTNGGALLNRVALLLEQRRVAEARDAAREALRHHPDDANLHWNLGISHLLLGDFHEGWTEHEWRARSDAVDVAPDLPQVPWRGEDLTGRTLLVYGEQGFGDNIQFVRFVPELAKRARAVLLQMPAGLETLLAGLAPNCRLLKPGELLPAFDFHCPVMSLPARLGTTLENLPAKVPYLRADPARVREWDARLPRDGRPRVGIVWSGNPQQGNDRNRSMPLALLRRIEVPNCQFVSLQPRVRDGDLAELAAWPGLLDAGPQLHDFGDTAALMESLDLVISVCTAPAHLAGALGRPVWVLLSHAADWRWLLEREDSPWYPSARLFRQPARGDWDAVLQRVRAELLALPAG
jgi:tetratricopeptide (TPR) repeat protein